MSASQYTASQRDSASLGIEWCLPRILPWWFRHSSIIVAWLQLAPSLCVATAEVCKWASTCSLSWWRCPQVSLVWHSRCFHGRRSVSRTAQRHQLRCVFYPSSLQRICPCLLQDLGKACAHSFCVTFVSCGRQAILPPTFGFMTSARIASAQVRAGTLVARSTGLRQLTSTLMLPHIVGLFVHASRCTQRRPVHATPVVITLALIALGVFDNSVINCVWGRIDQAARHSTLVSGGTGVVSTAAKRSGRRWGSWPSSGAISASSKSMKTNSTMMSLVTRWTRRMAGDVFLWNCLPDLCSAILWCERFHSLTEIKGASCSLFSIKRFVNFSFASRYPGLCDRSGARLFSSTLRK